MISLSPQRYKERTGPARVRPFRTLRAVTHKPFAVISLSQKMTEITADNLPGKVMAPAAAYLTDKYTNRDIFGVVRGKCSEVSSIG